MACSHKPRITYPFIPRAVENRHRVAQEVHLHHNMSETELAELQALADMHESTDDCFDSYLDRISRIILKLYKHLDDREMTIGQLRTMSSLNLQTRKNRKALTPKEIASVSQQSVREVEAILPELVELRYINEVVPLTGPVRYRIGPMAGMLKRVVLNAIKEDEFLPKPPPK
jgi:hypothetical protein